MRRPQSVSVLVARAASKLGVSQETTAAFLQALAEQLGEMLAEGPVRIPSLGTFRLGSRVARTVLNPRTKRPMRLPRAVEVRFRAAKVMRERVRR